MGSESGRILCSRQILEDLEREQKECCIRLNLGLAELFTLSSESKGRLREEADDGDWRTIFQRDYDRILWCDAYARLRNKTQTALQPINQEITTRLTHTIKVTQLAMRLCQFLSLNHELGGAIGAGHDLGHTPFGHAGEDAITAVVRKILGNPDYRFSHAEYSLVVVDRVEKDGGGINLSLETRAGILNHSRGKGSIDTAICEFSTPESDVAMWSDKFAYLSSDIWDFLKLGFLEEGMLPAAELRVLGCGDGYSKSRILDALNYGLVTSSLAEGRVCFAGERRAAFDVIRDWMYDNVYGKGPMEPEFDKAKDMIERVFMHVLETRFGGLPDQEAVDRTIDVVACMTDDSIDRYHDENLKPKRIY
ncbi:HD domain-containing protein [Candidatus Woesearchaeota archaeon]|nr:HD domain-containing protein [Candidatus Woesearchaeota archaeon]